jgi:hypothetical protein
VANAFSVHNSAELYVISNRFVQKGAKNNMCTFFSYLMNKGVLINNKLQYEFGALQNYRIRQSMLILKAIRVVAEVLIQNKNSPTSIDVGTYQQVNRIWRGA